MDKTSIKFNVYNLKGPCNVCGKIGDVGDLHKFRIIKGFGKKECGGTYMRVCAKHQGGRVKKYRAALKTTKVKFTETMFINTCVCSQGFKPDIFYEPGQMIVIFTKEISFL